MLSRVSILSVTIEPNMIRLFSPPAKYKAAKVATKEAILKGKGSTADLLVLTSLDVVLLKLKLLFTSVLKQATLMRRSNVLSLPLQLVFCGATNFSGLTSLIHILFTYVKKQVSLIRRSTVLSLPLQ
jgi:hypothetical protein